MKSIKRPASPGVPAPGEGLTLAQLRYFLAAARHGNFTHAAESSFLSQSAFSRQIQALEEALGAPVFDRVGRRVRLNDAGEELERRAAEILARVERLAADLVPVGKGLRGTVRLGANMSIGIGLVPSWLAAFQQHAPNVHVTLLLRMTTEMPPLLRSESIDASIQEAHDLQLLEGKPPLCVRMSFEDELWVVGPKGTPPDYRPGPRDRWFGNADPYRRRKLGQLGIHLDDTTRVPSLEVSLLFVEAGLGFALIPGFMARAAWKAGRVARLDASVLRTVAFITLGDRPLSPCLQRLMDFLKPRWETEAARQKVERAKRGGEAVVV
ncbi:MAG: LysR family transcriptional regulator [Planctomycetota bacterium]|nr:LysR family transcriptional regulator [Planctomycetota bacterium]